MTAPQPNAPNTALSTALRAWLRTLLRSLGQVVLQPNAFTGVCLLAAWLLSGPRLACAALIGAIAANLNATLAGCPEADTRVGMHGFNGALAGLVAFILIADPLLAAIVSIAAASCTAWLLRPLSRWLRMRGLCCFSSPYLIITWLWLPFLAGHMRAASALPVHSLDALRFGNGVLTSLAQSAFAPGPLAGVLVLIGIAGASRKQALYGLIGAALGCAMHLLLHASPGLLDSGMLGFNGALTALALAGLGIGFAPVLGGVAISVLLQMAAAHFGWPALTAPFVLAAWSIQWLQRRNTHEPVAQASGAESASTN
ncbi:urea transporter [Paraburkholderia sp. ZP32-5]|uniref:urea transporter n=1 Tax=Paraburkholderia sp. ZP32-5 TaxID=2883245 RepID=UPI001F3FFE88|nr:urea transporter [Paraburkholderia sp. ZP32-5]